MIIVIAEDEADTRDMMKVLLELEGHEVYAAADGQQAVAVATANKPDLVLMDLSMPVMDGFAATRALRQSPATRAIPVIAVSAYVSDKEWCDRALAAGCIECVPKPVDYAKLGEILGRFAPAA